MSYRSKREVDTIVSECCERNQAVMSGDVPTMSSKTIADIADKQHKHVIDKIKKMMGKVSQSRKLGPLYYVGYREITYDSGPNIGKIQEIHLNFKAARLLVSRYDLLYCADLFERLDELEAKNSNVTLVSQPGTERNQDTVNQYQDPSISMSMSGLGHLVERYYGAKIQMQIFTRYITGVVTCQSLDGDTEISPDYTEMFMMKGGYVAVKWNSLIEAEAWLFNHIDNCIGGIDLDRMVIKDRGVKYLNHVTEK